MEPAQSDGRSAEPSRSCSSAVAVALTGVASTTTTVPTRCTPLPFQQEPTPLRPRPRRPAAKRRPGAARVRGPGAPPTVADVDEQVAKRISPTSSRGARRSPTRPTCASPGSAQRPPSGNAAASRGCGRDRLHAPLAHRAAAGAAGRPRARRRRRPLRDRTGHRDARAPWRTLGTYVMSVQDDTGYVKLVSRLIGVPVELYRGRSPADGHREAPPPLPATEADVRAPAAPTWPGVRDRQLP